MTPILMYHEVTAANRLTGDVTASWTVSPEQFEAHMSALADVGYVGMSVARWLETRDRPSMPKSVVLTFDDGFRGNIEYAIPALLNRGWTATIFVISGKMGSEGYADPVDWKAAAEAGMDIGSHTATHPYAGMLTANQLRSELLDSRLALEDAIGGPVHGLSWPNGDAPRDGRQLLLECGYKWAATSRAAFASDRSDTLSLPRLAVRAWHSASGLSQLMDMSASHRIRMAAMHRVKRVVQALLGRRRYARLQMKAMGDI